MEIIHTQMAEPVGEKPLDEEADDDVNYKAPAPKSLEEIKRADEEDESLAKYKETLLGKANKETVVIDENNKLNAIVQKMALCITGRDDIELDLTGDLDKLKDSPFVLKEGCSYKIKIYFYVQREIVTGFRYAHSVNRKGIKVDKASYMVGSYGPKHELQVYTSPEDEAPSGMLARGDYKVKSKFIDDDKNVYKEWVWTLRIKKDWE